MTVLLACLAVTAVIAIPLFIAYRGWIGRVAGPNPQPPAQPAAPTAAAPAPAPVAANPAAPAAPAVAAQRRTRGLIIAERIGVTLFILLLLVGSYWFFSKVFTGSGAAPARAAEPRPVVPPELSQLSLPNTVSAEKVDWSTWVEIPNGLQVIWDAREPAAYEIETQNQAEPEKLGHYQYPRTLPGDTRTPCEKNVWIKEAVTSFRVKSIDPEAKGVTLKFNWSRYTPEGPCAGVERKPPPSPQSVTEEVTPPEVLEEVPAEPVEPPADDLVEPQTVPAPPATPPVPPTPPTRPVPRGMPTSKDFLQEI